MADLHIRTAQELRERPAGWSFEQHIDAVRTAIREHGSAALAVSFKPEDENRDWVSLERKAFDRHTNEVRALEALELRMQESPEGQEVDYRQVVNAHSTDEPRGYDQQGRHTGGGHTYRQGDSGPSWVKDLKALTGSGDPAARDRLLRNNREVEQEHRALAGNIDGSGGEFVPPAWLMNQIVTVARPTRVWADRMNKQPLPAGTDSINIPRVTSGTEIAAQATQNSEVTNTDAETDSIAASLETLAGQQTLSFQLVDQSPAAIDQIVLQDLAAELAMRIDLFALSNNATGKKGILNTAGVNAITYTSGSPTPAALYSKIAQAISEVSTSRYAPPDVIVMHPRRFAWLTAASDTTGRPLVVPVAQMPSNVLAAQGGVVAEGLVGSIQGLPCFVDANLPVNMTVGASGGHQDVVIVARSSDLYLWESPVKVIADRVSLANKLSMRLVMWEYVAVQNGRYPASTSLITGTGLEAPTF